MEPPDDERPWAFRFVLVPHDQKTLSVEDVDAPHETWRISHHAAQPSTLTNVPARTPSAAVSFRVGELVTSAHLRGRTLRVVRVNEKTLTVADAQGVVFGQWRVPLSGVSAT